MITLHSTRTSDVTVLSNIFIDRFMPRANGEFVKVYIYLLRMLESPQEAFGLSQMADSLFCTEGDILRALKYWENEKLVSLSYEANVLTGITLQTPWNEITTIAAAAEPTVIPAAAPQIEDSASSETAAPSSPETVSSRPASEIKPLTLDRVKELKQNEDIVQLLYIAEQYLGKTLTPTETRKILFFYDELHMSVDLIDYLIEYCVGRDHRSIRYIETVAMTKEYGFTMDLIQEACSRTVLQTGQPSFPYADKILRSWNKKNIRTLEDVRLQDAQHQKRKLEKAVNKPAPQPKASNRFNNFHQRDYDFAEYEKKLLNNSTN